jgi:isoaspartyl peptidase/L-asparaginase-like protein (Ntn-hydrolase superfamily)
MSTNRVRIALHGGSGATQGHDYGREIENMRGLVESGRDRLHAGASAIDVVTEAVAALESSGLYIAGRGASPSLAGSYELDASLMDGSTGRAGAVASLCGFRNPIVAARAVMDITPHVLYVGDGAARFALNQALPAVLDAKAWYTEACRFESNYLPESMTHGTVGCVALDRLGNLAAATSTAGVFGKPHGRVGDSAIIGAGTWADDGVAISCTGQGEFFIRSAAAVQVAHRIRFGGQTLAQAADEVLSEVANRGGTGGLIAVDSRGNVVMPFRSSGMKRAALLADGSIVAHAH